MTNEQIISEARFSLMKAGIIGTTGETLVLQNMNGEEVEYPMPEPIHTFQAWKELGYCVKKGEHAIAKFPIWKHTVKEKDNGEKQESMFMKTAHFFKRSQVEFLGKEN